MKSSPAGSREEHTQTGSTRARSTQTRVYSPQKGTGGVWLEFCGIFIFFIIFVVLFFFLYRLALYPLLKLLILPHKLEQKFLRN